MCLYLLLRILMLAVVLEITIFVTSVVVVVQAQNTTAAATTTGFTFSSNFSSLDVVVRGLASTQYDSLTLTLGSKGSSRAFYRYPVTLIQPRTNRSVSFNTSFVFQILGFSDNEGQVADGIVFLLAPPSLVEGASPLPGGTCLGFTCSNYNSNDNYDGADHLFGVEYDTFKNYCDPDGDHIGIDINSVNSTAVAQLHLNSTAGHNSSISLHKNMTLQSWIEYRGGEIGNVRVWLAENGSSRPELPHIDFDVDLHRVISPIMYVGFSASSGSQGSLQTIFSWSFTSEGVTNATPTGSRGKGSLPPSPSPWPLRVPPPFLLGRGIRDRGGRRRIKIIAAAAGAASSVVVCIFLWILLWRRRRMIRRRRWEGMKESSAAAARSILELGTLVNYSYKELNAATKGFKEIIGKGGSCKVYKGLLPSTGSLVAVKSLTSNAPPSQNQFLAELNVISKVRHQKLVALKGWCHDDGNLLLVYEFMSRGSLDKLLFPKSTSSKSFCLPCMTV